VAEERKDDRGFVVIDRRGRSEESGRDASAPDAGSEPRREPPPRSGEAEGPDRDLPRIDFATFILSLSTSALHHLGLVPDPETHQPGPVNKIFARQTIDTLELLQEKTRGNLDADEQRLLEGLLYELRMRYVEVR
jgi:Domain of unknown function (DUF1844)